MVIEKYDAHEFNVTIIHGDIEFNIAQLKEYLVPILVKIYWKDGYVDIIERVIRVMKEDQCIPQ